MSTTHTIKVFHEPYNGEYDEVEVHTVYQSEHGGTFAVTEEGCVLILVPEEDGHYTHTNVALQYPTIESAIAAARACKLLDVSLLSYEQAIGKED